MKTKDVNKRLKFIDEIDDICMQNELSTVDAIWLNRKFYDELFGDTKGWHCQIYTTKHGRLVELKRGRENVG